MSEVLKEAPEHEIVGNVLRLLAYPGGDTKIEEIKDSIGEQLTVITDTRQRTIVIDALMRITESTEQPPLHPGIQISKEDRTVLREALEDYAKNSRDRAEA